LRRKHIALENYVAIFDRKVQIHPFQAGKIAAL
jgi:hypothetical protein